MGHLSANKIPVFPKMANSRRKAVIHNKEISSRHLLHRRITVDEENADKSKSLLLDNVSYMTNDMPEN
jgi:hypothetical protein